MSSEKPKEKKVHFVALHELADLIKREKLKVLRVRNRRTGKVYEAPPKAEPSSTESGAPPDASS